MSWGDGGPQLVFSTNADHNAGQSGALIFTDHDMCGTGVSWHFVSNQGDWNVNSKRFVAKTSVSVGVNVPNTSYNLYVAGTASITGATTGASFGASSYLATNTGNSSTTGGLSLYSTNPTSYGIAMRGTTNGGKHGYVQGDWAIYSYMNGSGADTAATSGAMRGWILQNAQKGTDVASVSGLGHAVFNGSVTVGGNATNTSGCELIFSEST